MNLSLSQSELDFRARVRGWIDANLLDEWRYAQGVEAETAWQRRLYEGGWMGVHWPPEFGGRGASAVEYLILIEELALAGAPEIVNRVGVNLVGPTLIAHGTPEQKSRYLRPILGADEIWCQLYSEPGAGSDLAALDTRAELRNGDYLVTGQKVWSSYAHFSAFGLALVRTGPEKHGGLSCLLVPMEATGVDVRPLRQLTGSREFCEVFLDGVRVPACNLVGAPGDGWRVAMTTLGHERGVGFPAKEWGVQRIAFDRLRELARGPLRAGALRDRIGAAWTDLEVLRLMNLRTVSRLGAGDEPGAETSVTKLHWSGLARRMTELALDLIGPGAGRTDGPHGWWAARHLWSRSCSIAGGTDEVQRNILAERVLGLPRGAQG